MALTSPGVQVSVVDESFYTPAEPGTVPVIFVATEENKLNASATGTALGTLAANVGKPYLLTSQRDLAETFGDPKFQIDASNNPVHGSELNEYGLQAAYSYLGVSNRAWVVRADIDLGQLTPRSAVPTADPDPGVYWLDTSATLFGIQEWNNNPVTVTGGQTFSNKVPFVITDVAQVTGTESSPGAPVKSIGKVGDYAVVAVSNLNTIWYRGINGWVELGSDAWQNSWPVVVSSKDRSNFTGADFALNGTQINVNEDETVTDIAETINGAGISGIRAAVVNGELAIYSDGTSSVELLEALDGTALAVELGIAPGTYQAPIIQISKHTQVPETFKTSSTENGRPTGSVWIKTTEPNQGASWRVKQWNDNTKLWESIQAPIFPNNESALVELDRVGGGTNLSLGDLYVVSNVAGDSVPMATFKIYRRASVGPTSITSGVIGTSSFSANPTYTFSLEETTPGSASLTGGDITFDGGEDAVTVAQNIANAITQSTDLTYVSASVDSLNRLVLEHSEGGEIRLTDTSGLVTVGLGISVYVDGNTGTRFVQDEPGVDNSSAPIQYRISNWETLNYTPSASELTNTSTNGTLWYNSIVDEVDILINNGTNWVGYKYDGTAEPSIVASPVATLDTDPNGPIVSASKPTLQSNGDPLVQGDLWLDTSDLENYPVIYRYTGVTQDRWDLIDNTDQTTENGIEFGDARYGSSGATGNTAAAISDLLTSPYVDPDAPDPTLYPRGTLLFNTRRSGFNVKRFVENYVDTGESAINLRYKDEFMKDYAADRWVTYSPNNEDGSGSFGRNAQRKVVVQSLQAVVNSNDEIRNEDARRFNLIACPGYPELIGELVTLNVDRGLSAFVVGDSPARLTPDATSLNDWATNVRTAVEDNDDGLVTNDEYLGVFYP